MNYEEFKVKLLEEIEKIYGKTAMVKIQKVLKNNGQGYDGLQMLEDSAGWISPIVNVEELYEIYIENGLRIKLCVEWICELLDKTRQDTTLSEFSRDVRTWEGIKEDVYPLLILTENNQELLKTLVSTPMLDMSIIYVISRKKEGREIYSVKITQAILNEYGITGEELHEQALKNMKKDNYRFISMDTYAKQLLQFMGIDEKRWDEHRHSPMFVLMNDSRIHGASGILDKELLKEFAGNKNYFIFLSCIHEAIFLPDDGELEREDVNELVADVYRNAVSEEEQLSNHYYYYYGETDEIVCD